MKSLQQYLLEELEYNDSNIQEGAIWDAIKNWFKSIFDPSDRPYDRYGDEDITGATKQDYISYLQDNFAIDNCEVKMVDKKTLRKLINPKGVKPNQDTKEGFYKFMDIESNKSLTWISIIYKDEKTKDCPAIIKSKIVNEKTLEILDFQIISEYVNVFKVHQLFTLLKENISNISSEINKIIFKESSDKSIYNQLVNDCNYNSEFDKDDNTNIAFVEL